jgi:hypothetical protein
MKKGLVISFICIHLFGNTELNQVFRLPQLISHYFQHSRIDPGINFFEFLAMHYGGDDGTDADNTEDSKLPCHNTTQNTISVFFSPMVIDISSCLFSLHTRPDYNSRLVTGISSKHVLLILQPPRA